MRFTRCAAALVLCLPVIGCDTAGNLPTPLQGKVDEAVTSKPGQLFCLVQRSGGGSAVVRLIDAAASSAAPGVAPIAILATGATKDYVDRACARAGVGGKPVSPPLAPDAAPMVAVVPPTV